MSKNDRIKDAVFLVDDNVKYTSYLGRLQFSSWDIDTRGYVDPQMRTSPGILLSTDESNEYSVSAKREIVPCRAGKVYYQCTFTIHSGDGLYIEFFDASQKKRIPAFELSARDGYIFAGDQKLPVLCENKKYYLNIVFDLDRKKAEVFFDEISCGVFKLQGKGLSAIKAIIPSYKKCCAVINHTRVWVNYLLLDKCYIDKDGPLAPSWKFSSKGKAVADRRKYYEGQDFFTNAIVTVDEKSAVLSRRFEKTSGKVCFEIKYLPKKDGISAVFSLTSGLSTLISVEDNGNALIAKETDVVLRTHHVNVWQTLRIEADTDAGRALIKLNGKKCSVLDFKEGKKADGIKIEFACPGGGVLKFTDVLVFVIQPEPEDYVPEPVLPKKKDYAIGMNICSIWREGNQFGWDCISPFEDHDNYLGYYDEGLPEVADWEIKWMAEHGLDFELYCWYNNQANAPLLNTPHNFALHDGHFNAKYGDKMKFAIIWEAMNGAPVTSDTFRNYILPYWMDHYFSDSRYFTVDNKVLVSVFGSAYLIRQFGSPAAVKAEFDYLREAVKTLGYDGAVFISCGDPSKFIADCGFDAVHAYSWGYLGYSPRYNKERMMEGINRNVMHVIPTVSVGFNSIGWNVPRTPMMKPADMGDVLEWIKSDALPKESDEPWKKKLVMFSTWNEYGEGTYICPTNECGFGYLDEMRKAFTYEKEPHTDVRPDAKQLRRTGYLYPQGRGLLKPMQLDETIYEKSVPVYSLDMSIDAWEPQNGLEISAEDGKICGKTNRPDPQIIYKPELNVDLSDVTAIRVRMKAETDSHGLAFTSVFFTTDLPGENEWTESKGVSLGVDNDEIKDYVFKANRAYAWKGKLTGLRIDPTNYGGDFVIEKVELLSNPDVPKVFIDGNRMPLLVPPVIEGENAYLPVDSASLRARFYHEWNKDTQTLLLVYKDKEMRFTVGDKFFTLNSKKINLEREITRSDGLVMLPLKELSEICEFELSIDGNVINIKNN